MVCIETSQYGVEWRVSKCKRDQWTVTWTQKLEQWSRWRCMDTPQHTKDTRRKYRLCYLLNTESNHVMYVHHLLNLPSFVCRDHLTSSSKPSGCYEDCHASSMECLLVMLPTVTVYSIQLHFMQSITTANSTNWDVLLTNLLTMHASLLTGFCSTVGCHE